jgi:hypothetical protein
MTCSNDLFKQQEGDCPHKKKIQSEKDGTITSLRAENRRLKELSAALAHMYDMKNLPRISAGHLVDSQVSLDDASMISSPESTSYFGKPTAENYQSYDFPTTDVFPIQMPSNGEPFSPSRYSTQYTRWTDDLAHNPGFPANSSYSMLHAGKSSTSCQASTSRNTT